MAKNLVRQLAIALVSAVAYSTAAMVASAQTPTGAGQLISTSDVAPSISSAWLRGEFSFTLPSSIAPTLDPVGRGRFEFSPLHTPPSPFPPDSNAYVVTQFELLLYGRLFSYNFFSPDQALFSYEPFVVLPAQLGEIYPDTLYALNYELIFDDPTFPLFALIQEQGIYTAIPSTTLDIVTGSVSYGSLTLPAPLTPLPIVPTPALLPALIGMGISVWRKRTL